MYVPSALVVHSNTPLADPEHKERASFTQYFPGAILRWVDNGFTMDKELRQRDLARFANLAAWKKGRLEEGLAMFLTLDEILDSLDSK